MKKIVYFFTLIYLSMNVISCSDTSIEKSAFNAKEVKGNIKQQEMLRFIKKNSSIKDKQEKDGFSTDMENTPEINLEILAESPALLKSSENISIDYEQDSGMILDPENEDDFYFISSSSDDLNAYTEQDTGEYLYPDLL